MEVKLIALLGNFDTDQPTERQKYKRANVYTNQLTHFTLKMSCHQNKVYHASLDPLDP